MNKRKFEIKLWKEKESNLFVITYDKPKVATQGKNLKEAFTMLGDAIQLYGDENSSYTQNKSNTKEEAFSPMTFFESKPKVNDEKVRTYYKSIKKIK